MSLAEFDGVLHLSNDDSFDQFARARVKLDRIEIDAEVIRESSMLRDGYAPNPFSGVDLNGLSRLMAFNPLSGGNVSHSSHLNTFDVSKTATNNRKVVVATENSAYISLAKTEKSIWLSLVVAALFVGCLVSASIFVEGFINPVIALLAVGVVVTLALTTFFARRELRKTQ